MKTSYYLYHDEKESHKQKADIIINDYIKIVAKSNFKFFCSDCLFL